MRDCKIKLSAGLSLTDHIINKYLTPNESERESDNGRSQLLTLFPSFKCHMVNRPGSEEPHLTPIPKLEKNFDAGIKDAIKILCNNINWKKCIDRNDPLTSDLYVKLAKEYIVELNTYNGIADLSVSWKATCHNRLESLSKELVRDYQKKMEEIKFPVEEDGMNTQEKITLHGKHTTVLHDKKKTLKKECEFLLPGNETTHSKIENDMKERIMTIFELLKLKNHNVSEDHCSLVFNRLYDTQRLLNLEDLRKQYMVEAIGPAKDIVYEKETSHIPGPPVVAKSEIHQRNEKTVVLKWNKPKVNPDAAESYELEIKGVNGDSWKKLKDNVQSPLNITSSAFKEMLPNYTYKIRLRGHNKSKKGIGEFSKPCKITVPCGVPCKPSSPVIQVCMDDPTKVKLSIAKLPELEENGKPVKKIIIQKSDDEKEWINCKENDYSRHKQSTAIIMKLDNYNQNITPLYKYRVIMKNDIGDSEPSSPVNLDPAEIIPGQVLKFKTTGVTCESISLSWDKPDVNPSAVDMYQVDYKKNGDRDYKSLNNTRKCSVTIPSLNPRTKYTIAVIALNSRKQHVQAISLSDIETLLAKPIKPEPPSIYVGRKSISVTFNLNKEEEPRKVVIHRHKQDKSIILPQHTIDIPSNLFIADTSEVKVKHKIDYEDQIYFISVQCENEVGNSTSSNLTSVNPSDHTIPGTPLNLKQEIAEEGNILKVAWTKPEERARPITVYRVQMKKPSENRWGREPICTVETSATFRHLNYNTDYDIRVCACNGHLEGSNSPIITMKTGCGVPAKPSRPSVRFDEVSNNVIFKTQPISPGDEYGSPIKRIIIQCLRENGEWESILTETYKLDNFEYRLLNTFGSNRELFRIQLQNDQGESEPSDICSFDFNDLVPGQVEDLNCEDKTSTTVKLRWRVPTRFHEFVFGYCIKMSEHQGEWRILETNCKETFLTISELAMKTDYTFAINAKSQFTDGKQTLISVTTNEDFPGQPMSLTALARRADKIKFRWSPPEEYRTALEFYEVQCKKQSTGEIVKSKKIKKNAHSTVVKGLDSNTSYTFQLTPNNICSNYKSTSIATLKDISTRFSTGARIALTSLTSVLTFPVLAAGGIATYIATRPDNESECESSDEDFTDLCHST